MCLYIFYSDENSSDDKKDIWFFKTCVQKYFVLEPQPGFKGTFKKPQFQEYMPRKGRSPNRKYQYFQVFHFNYYIIYSVCYTKRVQNLDADRLQWRKVYSLETYTNMMAITNLLKDDVSKSSWPQIKNIQKWISDPFHGHTIFCHVSSACVNFLEPRKAFWGALRVSLITFSYKSIRKTLFETLKTRF